ncbi:hypothetical protein G6F31_020526 [Rhizopus arrhizus]|nr:hypothetical protein G6F31_020526 [Rhizopus arrhizus]
MHDEYGGHRTDIGDVVEAGERVIAALLHQRGRDRQGRRIRHQQGVAVGLRLGDLVRADVAGGARTVFDDHRGARVAGQRRRDQARQHVGRSAGGRRHDEGDGLVGIRAGDGGADQCGADGQRGQAAEKVAVHGGIPLVLLC